MQHVQIVELQGQLGRHCEAIAEDWHYCSCLCLGENFGVRSKNYCKRMTTTSNLVSCDQYELYFKSVSGLYRGIGASVNDCMG